MKDGKAKIFGGYMNEILLHLTEYSAKSSNNMVTLFILGIVCYVISVAFNNFESNHVQIIIAGITKVGCYLFLLVSITTFVFYTTNRFKSENHRIECAYADRTMAMLGGQDTLNSMKDTFKESGIDMGSIYDVKTAVNSSKELVTGIGKQEVNLLKENNYR